MKKIVTVLTIAVLALVIYFFTRGDAYPITNESPRGTTIIAFGDSLTSGHGAGGDGYPEQLARKLGIPVINAGVSGDTAEGARARLERDVLSKDPRIVILCLGANDYFRKRNIDEVFADLDAIITRIQEKGALVIVVAVQLPMSKYPQRYRELAIRKGCPFVPDLLDGILSRPELMADEVHPNAQGYALVVNRIEPVIRKYLQKSEK